MLTLADIPGYLEMIYQEQREISIKIQKALKGKETLKSLVSQSDLLPLAPSYVFSHDGFFKLYQGKKMIRFYSEGDLFFINPTDQKNGCRLITEFGCQVFLYKEADVLKELSQDSNLFALFIRHQQLDIQIALHLGSLYIAVDVSPDVEIKSYKPGERIICEGDKSDQIFIMVSGHAIVSKCGKEIGEVKESDVFGEISFLTKQVRTATVTAQTNCLIQALGEKDFFQVIPQKPVLMMALCTSMAKRIVALNELLLHPTNESLPKC